MYAERSVKAGCGEHAEALDYAEVFRRDRVHAHCAHEHHAESNGGAHSVGAVFHVPCARDDDRDQRGYRQDNDQHRNDKMHLILKRTGIAASAAERKRAVAHGGDPLHYCEDIDPDAQRSRLFPLNADAHYRCAQHLADVIQAAETVPQSERGRISSAQIADACVIQS